MHVFSPSERLLSDPPCTPRTGNPAERAAAWARFDAFEEARRAYQDAAAAARRAERTYYEQGTDEAHRARVETLRTAVRAAEVMVAAREAAGLPHPCG